MCHLLIMYFATVTVAVIAAAAAAAASGLHTAESSMKDGGEVANVFMLRRNKLACHGVHVLAGPI